MAILFHRITLTKILSYRVQLVGLQNPKLVRALNWNRWAASLIPAKGPSVTFFATIHHCM